MKQLFTYILLLLGYTVTAQDVVLKSFDVLTDGKYVYASWTIAAGATCNGTTIFRSEDDNYYYEVGKIDGICGNLNEPASYSFTDTTPITNKVSYYKLRLGQMQFTDARTVFFTNASIDYTLYPNPAKDYATLIFPNDNELYSVALYDMYGRRVIVYADIRSPQFQLKRKGLPTGLYLFTIHSASGRSAIGKLLLVD